MKEFGIFNKIASVASIILWTFIIFSGGLVAGQMEGFQKLKKGLLTGEAQAEMLSYARDPFDKELTVWNDTPGVLQGGALLIGSHFISGPALLLVDASGKILHSWTVEKKLFNNEILRWWKEPKEISIVAIDDAHLLPGGDVIFTQDLRDLQNFRGQRLARMDLNSHIVWQVPGTFHHEFDIGGSPQGIYALTSTMRDELPVIGTQLGNARYLEDWVVEYTLDGKKVDSWSIPEAFAHSPYSNMLTLFENDLPDLQKMRSPYGDQKTLYDLLHLNSVQYLDAAHAKALPQAKEGDLLISLRGLNSIAVLRPSLKQIVWATRGPWLHQHYVRVEDDGKLYVYDNEGARVIVQDQGGLPVEQLKSRILSYDPFNGQWMELFSSTKMHSYWRGYYYFLPGGNIIVSSPQRSRVIVVSPEKKILWELRGVLNRDMDTVPYLKQLSTVRYYPPVDLAFLKEQKKP